MEHNSINKRTKTTTLPHVFGFDSRNYYYKNDYNCENKHNRFLSNKRKQYFARMTMYIPY